MVEAHVTADDGKSGQTVRLIENESVRVEKSVGDKPTQVLRGKATPAVFVRAEQLTELVHKQRLSPLRRWQAYSEQLRKDPALVAYYMFEKHNLGTSILPNHSAAGSALDGRIEGCEWVDGRLPGKLALLFHGANSGDRVVLPDQKRFDFTQPFSVAVWFQSPRFSTPTVCSLIAKGRLTWRIERYGDRY